MLRSLAALTRSVVSPEVAGPPAVRSSVGLMGRASMASTASECPDRMAVQFRVAVSKRRICGRHSICFGYQAMSLLTYV